MSLTLDSPAAVPQNTGAFRDALRVLKRHKLMVAAGMLFGLAAAIALICVLPPTYTATGVVAVTPPQPDPFPAPNAPAQEQLDARSIGTEVVALTSANLAKQVVDAFGIDAHAKPGLHQRLCSWSWMPRVFCQGVSMQSSETKRIEAFMKHLQVAPVKSTNDSSWAVSVAYTSPDPALSAKVVNKLIADRQHQEVQHESAQLNRTADWLQQRTNELRAHWIAAEQAVARFREQHRLSQTLAGDKMAPLMGQQIASAVNQYGLAESKLAEAQAEEQTLHRAISAGDERALLRLPDQPILVDLAKSLNKLELKRSFMANSYKSNMLGALNRQIAQAKHDIKEESQRALSQIKNEVSVRTTQVHQLEQNLAGLKAQFNAAGAPLAQVEALEREAADASAVYASFLTRSKQLASRTPMLSPTTVVLSSAESPDRPSFPEPGKVLPIGLVLGLVAGAGAAWGREKLSIRVSDIGRIGLDFAVPLLSVIPSIPGEHRLGMPMRRYVGERPFSAAAEAVRALGTAVTLASRSSGGGSCSVAIASALSQEGKSTLCYWLAEISARGGDSVLLVDGDYRKNGDIARTGTPGLTDVLAGEISVDAAIIRNGAAPMHYLPSGAPRPGAFTGGDLDRLRQLISELKQRYALVIIDSPPLLGVSEGLIYASIADQTVFLCRWQRTGRAAVTGCLNRLRAAGARVTGIALTMVDTGQMPLYSDEYDRQSVRSLRQYYLN